MATWGASTGRDQCGYCSAVIPSGEPVQLIGPAALWREQKLKRCEEHRLDGTEVDRAAVDHEKSARGAHPERHLPVKTTTQMVRDSRGLRSFDDVFDAKRAAAGRDE